MIGEHLPGSSGALVSTAETVAGLEPDTRDALAGQASDELQDSASDYWQGEMEEFEEFQEDPAGETWENFMFGLTGPAPSLNPDLSIDYGDGLLGAVNRGAWQDLEDGTDRAGQGLPWWTGYAVAGLIGSIALMAFSYTVGQLVTFEV